MRERARLIRSASAAGAPDARRVMQRPRHAGRADCIANFQRRFFCTRRIATASFFACSFLLIKRKDARSLTTPRRCTRQTLTPRQTVEQRRKVLAVLQISARLATLQNNYLLRRLLIYGLRSAHARSCRENGVLRKQAKRCGFCVTEQKKISHNAGAAFSLDGGRANH